MIRSKVIYKNYQVLVTPKEEYYVEGETACSQDEDGRLRTGIV